MYHSVLEEGSPKRRVEVVEGELEHWAPQSQFSRIR